MGMGHGRVSEVSRSECPSEGYLIVMEHILDIINRSISSSIMLEETELNRLQLDGLVE